MQLYQFEKIYTQMAKEYGRVEEGNEDFYTLILFMMESNVLRIHRTYPASNSRKLRTAIGLVLYDIKERVTGQRTDVDDFRNEDTERLEQALLYSFDPVTNPEIKEVLAQIETVQPRELYKNPVKCLLKIVDSINLWEKHGGSNGYFRFIEQMLGNQVEGDKMDYFVERFDKPDF